MARGLSSAGRAPAWHAGGQRFDPARLHHYKKARESGPFLLLAVSSGRWRLGVVSCHSIARSLMKVSATFDRGKNFKTSWSISLAAFAAGVSQLIGRAKPNTPTIPSDAYKPTASYGE